MAENSCILIMDPNLVYESTYIVIKSTLQFDDAGALSFTWSSMLLRKLRT